MKVEKPTEAFLPKIFNVETNKDMTKILESAATVYTNLIIELVQSFPEDDLPVVLFALDSVEEVFAKLSPSAKLIADQMHENLKKLVIVNDVEREDL